jgi:hypothetical protein
MLQALLELIVASAPLLLFFGLLVYFVRSSGMGARGPSGRRMIEVYELQLEETKRNVAALGRIAQVLEKRGE